MSTKPSTEKIKSIEKDIMDAYNPSLTRDQVIARSVCVLQKSKHLSRETSNREDLRKITAYSYLADSLLSHEFENYARKLEQDMIVLTLYGVLLNSIREYAKSARELKFRDRFLRTEKYIRAHLLAENVRESYKSMQSLFNSPDVSFHPQELSL